MFNAAAQRMFGCTAAEAIGTEVARFVPPEARARHRELIREFARSGDAQSAMNLNRKVLALRSDGTRFPVEASISQAELPGTLGQGRLFTVLMRDVSEQRRAEEALRDSETRYRDLVQCANSAILGWSADGTITFLNDYAQTLFGWRADEAIGRHVGIFIPEEESSGADLRGLVQDIVRRPERYVNFVNPSRSLPPCRKVKS